MRAADPDAPADGPDDLEDDAPDRRRIVPRPHVVPDPAWYRRFFTGLALDMWEQAVPPQVTAAELDFVADLLDLDPDDPLLDVPCGTGRHSVALAARGYAVTAVDGSADSLARLRAAAAATEIGGALAIVQADMTALPFRDAFRGAVCLGNSFGYGPLAETRAFLAGVARALRPGGGLLIHSGTVAECLLPGLEAEEEIWVGEVHVAFENRYDPLAGRLDTRFVLTRGAETYDRLVSHFVFTIAEVGRLLAEQTLTLEAAFADPHGTPFELGAADDVYLFAKKSH